MSNIFDTEDSKPDRSMAVARAARKKNGQKNFDSFRRDRFISFYISGGGHGAGTQAARDAGFDPPGNLAPKKPEYWPSGGPGLVQVYLRKLW